jgi:hypothetical protein
VSVRATTSDRARIAAWVNVGNADTLNLPHFTCFRHFLQQYRDGEIRTTESEIGAPTAAFLAERGYRVDPKKLLARYGCPVGEQVGPDVVWLTTSPDVEAIRSVLVRPGVHIEDDKSRVRLTVTLPRSEVERWDDFARRHGINPKWHRALNEQGRGSASHCVIERSIQWAEVTEVTFDAELSKYVDQSVALKQMDPDGFI